MARKSSISKKLVKAFASFSDPVQIGRPQQPLFALQDDAAHPPLVASVDWRTKGAVFPPRHQGDCNTCTSFAVVSVIESLHYIKNHNRIQLAPGFVHTCLLNRSCSDGISPQEALTEIGAHGIAFGFPNDYPFPTTQCVTGNLYTIQRSAWLAGPNIAMQVLASQGPIVGDMFIDPEKFLRLGRGDIYNFQETPDQRLHTVAIIGYNMDQRYWIISNSFGTNWCDGGFGFVAFGSGGLFEERSGWQILL